MNSTTIAPVWLPKRKFELINEGQSSVVKKYKLEPGTILKEKKQSTDSTKKHNWTSDGVSEGKAIREVCINPLLITY